MIAGGVLRARLRLARNHAFPPTRGGGRRPRWGALALWIGVPAFATFLFGTLGVLFVQLQELGFGRAEAASALAFVFAAAMAGLVVFDLHYVVSALLLDSDLPLLRRAPLGAGQVFAIKLLDALPRTMLLLVLLAIPGAIGFALVHPLPAWGWALLPLQLAGLWAAPLGLGVCAALALVRAVPARRTREILALLSTLVLVGLWLVNAFVLPNLAGDAVSLDRSLEAALRPQPWMLASPPHWAGYAIAAAAGGEIAPALGWTLALLALGAAALLVAHRVASALLDETLARLEVDPGLRRGGRRPARRAPAGGLRALLLKDARLFARDWTVLGDVITGALLWTLLPLVARPLVETSPGLLARAMLVSLTVGLGYEVGARAVPFERSALAWARLAPIAAWRWNLAKLLAGLALSLPLLAIAMIAVGLMIPLSPADLAAAGVVALSALLLALASGLWTGWVFGDPAWTNPRAMLTFGGRMVASLLLVAQAGAWLGLLALLEGLGPVAPPGVAFWLPPAVAGIAASMCLIGAARSLDHHDG